MLVVGVGIEVGVVARGIKAVEVGAEVRIGL
jgi:hypothetical protein